MKLKNKLILVSLVSFFLCSCGAMKIVKKESPLPAKQEETKADKKAKPMVYYAGLEGLKLYPQPRFTKDFIAQLPLNEKVLR
jgi:hypothetical protein